MHPQPPLTAVVTCFNSEATLGECLASLQFCDELVVIDSGSTDASQEIARRHGARLHIEAFRGYAAQKQAAIDRSSHDWVLLLDSDEWLQAGAEPLIRAAIGAGDVAGYSLRRREWMFWRWQHPRSRHNRYLRLFDRRHARMSTHAVHESVRCDGPVSRLPVLLMHHGDTNLAKKIDKANHYSTLQQSDIALERRGGLRSRMVFYPAVAFLRYYLLRGHWREGWAGYAAARVHAFYAFAKYAKAYERRCAVKSETSGAGAARGSVPLP
ncbi:MAG: glycosyltransferase family 2 protein [Pseudomonadota bacterium]|nr:glycosyltransferase family 2 protein [Pseudomonadota bacterium]